MTAEPTPGAKSRGLGPGDCPSLVLLGSALGTQGDVEGNQAGEGPRRTGHLRRRGRKILDCAQVPSRTVHLNCHPLFLMDLTGDKFNFSLGEGSTKLSGSGCWPPSGVPVEGAPTPGMECTALPLPAFPAQRDLISRVPQWELRGSAPRGSFRGWNPVRCLFPLWGHTTQGYFCWELPSAQPLALAAFNGEPGVRRTT